MISVNYKNSDCFLTVLTQMINSPTKILIFFDLCKKLFIFNIFDINITNHN